MRQSLLENFNEIFILDLHGSTNKKERTPEGGKDENVFDIKQGVTIAVFVKNKNATGCQVFHADLWGLRKQKYSTLLSSDILSTDWAKLNPVAPNFFFVPSPPKELMDEYDSSWSLTWVFPVNGSGINTDRDALCLDFSADVLAKRMAVFFSGKFDETFRDRYDVRTTSSYNPESRAKNVTFSAKYIRRVVYRPFDTRFVYYQSGFTSRPVFEVHGNMLEPNVGLVLARQSKEPFATLVVDTICTHKIVTVYDRSSLFPLYIIPSLESELQLHQEHVPNLGSEFLKELAQRLSLPQTKPHALPEGVSAEDILSYVYAILYSPTYRRRYANVMKVDFPRVPFTADLELFRSIAALGSQLMALHLLKSDRVGNFITEFPQTGDNKVVRKQYTSKDQRVWINSSQYFAGVPGEVWQFLIGGRQVCEEWLKERRGRSLSYDDIQHYQKMIIALNETLRVMSKIDDTIDERGGWPGAFRR